MSIKSTVLVAAGLLMAGAATAGVTIPQFFSEDFVKMGQEGDYLTPEWITYGNGAAPSAEMPQGFFNPDGEGPYYVLLNYGSTTIPISCTNFSPSQPADQWLVTPVIEIPANDAELSFTASVYNNRGSWGQGKNPYRVLVSPTGGSAREDFTDEILSTTVSGSRTQEVAMKDVVCPVNGYSGKKVRVAFVSTGENLGMTGFTNIKLGNYAVLLDNRTPKVVELGKEVQVTVNVGMRTPVVCAGFTAELQINGGEKVETYYKKPVGNAGNTLIYQLVKFDPITVETTESLNYTITITPDYEGAPASVVTGTIGVPTMSYPANVVVEEVTATGCQACPSGTASMQYYKDTYPGDADGLNKVIGIAIHGFINYYDPMSEGTAEYLANLMDQNGTTSYPQAMFNRATSGRMPNNKEEAEKLFAARSFNKLHIKRVETEATREDPWGKKVRVDFESYNAFDAEGIDLRAAVVMVENNVSGNDKGYDQTNGFFNRGEEYIASSYGEFLVPYMRPYLAGGEFGMQMIPFTDMSYDHVARGIWPSFYGEALGGSWQNDEPRPDSLEFVIPETIMNLDNTEVVVLLIDGEDNRIVGSDVIEAKDYNNGSGVAAVELEGVKVVRENGAVSVIAPEGSVAEVYTMAGMRLATVAVSGSALIEAPAEPVIVKVNTPAGSAAWKLR